MVQTDIRHSERRPSIFRESPPDRAALAILPGMTAPLTSRLPRFPVLLSLAGVFLAVTLLAFGRSLTQGFAPVDDDLLIARNLAVRGITLQHLRTVFTTFDPELYIPLTFVSYQIDYLIGGLQPWIFHATNLLLHAANGLLMGWVLLLLTRNRIAALLPALLFTVHPLHTEAVVWLAGRKDLLSTFFYLAAFVGYLKYREGKSPDHRQQGAACSTPPWYGLSLLLFLFSLLSKVMAVTLPAALLLADICVERRKWSVRMLIDKILYAALSGIFLIVAMTGKERVVAAHSITETALMAAKSTTFYLEKILLPFGLGVFHPYRGGISLLLPQFFVPLLIVLVVIAAAIVSYRRWPWITFGILFFLVTLAPTFLNFHKGGEIYFASERYPYLPSLGMFFLLAMGIGLIVSRARTPILCVSAGLTVLFCGLSFRQTMIWDSADSLFSRTLALHPESIAARAALASMDRQRGRYDQAIKMLRDGLGYGDSPILRMGLGTVYAKIGRVEDAADQFRQGVALDPLNPEPLVGLGVLAEHEGKTDEALALYKKAVELDPSYVDARNKVGSMLLERGDSAGAEEQFRAALRWNPNAEGVLYNLSLILDIQGKQDEALPLLEDAYALSPDSPPIMIALARHLAKTDGPRARDILADALRMDPDNAEAHALQKELSPSRP